MSVFDVPSHLDTYPLTSFRPSGAPLRGLPRSGPTHSGLGPYLLSLGDARRDSFSPVNLRPVTGHFIFCSLSLIHFFFSALRLNVYI